MDEETVEEQVIDEGQIVVDQEEVLEEVVTTEEVYNENGDIVQFEDIVVYEDGNQEIVEEEYVDLDELQDGEEYSYMITDENGETRYIPAEEMRELVNSGQVVEDVVHEEVEIKEEKNIAIVSGEGTSQQKPRAKKSPNVGQSYGKRTFNDIYINKAAPTLRDLVENIASSSSKDTEVVYMQGDQYYDEHGNLLHNIVSERSGMGQVGPKRANLNDMAKVDVEKNIHRPKIIFRSPIDRPTHKTNVPYFGPNGEKRQKLIHPIHLDELKEPPSTLKPQTSVEAIDASQYRYRCPECEEIHHSLDKLCSHLVTLHDIPATIQQTDMYDESEFNKFLMSIEKAGCTQEEAAHRYDKKKTRNEQSQFFRCNYMFKSRETNYAEMVDISSAATNDVEETCPAFVLKVHTYDSIRLRYCDLHVHADANIGFRVPIAVKRRLMEWLYKRIPIPVMQMLLISEAEKMSQGGRVEQQLRELSTNQLAALLSKIHINFTLYEKLRHQHMNPHLMAEHNEHGIEVEPHVIYTEEVLMKPHEVHIEEVVKQKTGQKIEEEPISETQEGETEEIIETVEVVHEEVVQQEEEEEVEAAPLLERVEEEGGEEEEAVGNVRKEEAQPKIANEPVLECEGEQPATYEECLTISIPDHLLYDPESGNDVVIDEINEVELKFLEAYESDAQILLSEKQQIDRNRRRLQFLQAQIIDHFSNLDTLTHGMTYNDYELEMLEHLRTCATNVLEVVCGVEAEIRAQAFVSLPVDAIKNDLIASVSSKERRYVTSEKMGGGRRRPHMTPLIEAELKQQHQLHQELDEAENAIIEEDIYSRVNAMAPPHRSIGINSSGTFSLNKPNIPKQIPTPELTLRDVVLMDTGRTPKPWYKYSQRKPESVTTPRSVLEISPNRVGSVNPQSSPPPSTSSQPLVDNRVTQILNKAAASGFSLSEGPSTSTSSLPIKKRGRKRKDPLARGIPEDDAEGNIVMGITTDDNVPHAIAMGVDHEVTVSTEEEIIDTNNQIVEHVVPKNESLEDIRIKEEAEKVLPSSKEVPRTEEEPEVVVQPTVTRTGRVVKMKKWSD